MPITHQKRMRDRCVMFPVFIVCILSIDTHIVPHAVLGFDVGSPHWSKIFDFFIRNGCIEIAVVEFPFVRQEFSTSCEQNRRRHALISKNLSLPRDGVDIGVKFNGLMLPVKIHAFSGCIHDGKKGLRPGVAQKRNPGNGISIVVGDIECQRALDTLIQET